MIGAVWIPGATGADFAISRGRYIFTHSSATNSLMKLDLESNRYSPGLRTPSDLGYYVEGGYYRDRGVSSGVAIGANDDTLVIFDGWYRGACEQNCFQYHLLDANKGGVVHRLWCQTSYLYATTPGVNIQFDGRHIRHTAVGAGNDDAVLLTIDTTNGAAVGYSFEDGNCGVYQSIIGKNRAASFLSYYNSSSDDPLASGWSAPVLAVYTLAGAPIAVLEGFDSSVQSGVGDTGMAFSEDEFGIYTGYVENGNLVLLSVRAKDFVDSGLESKRAYKLIRNTVPLSLNGGVQVLRIEDRLLWKVDAGGRSLFVVTDLVLNILHGIQCEYYVQKIRTDGTFVYFKAIGQNCTGFGRFLLSEILTLRSDLTVEYVESDRLLTLTGLSGIKWYYEVEVDKGNTYGVMQQLSPTDEWKPLLTIGEGASILPECYLVGYKGTIRGQLRAGTNTRLSGTVYAMGAGVGSVERTTRAGDDGVFEFDDLVPGREYSILAVSDTGYVLGFYGRVTAVDLGRREKPAVRQEYAPKTRSFDPVVWDWGTIIK